MQKQKMDMKKKMQTGIDDKDSTRRREGKKHK